MANREKTFIVKRKRCKETFTARIADRIKNAQDAFNKIISYSEGGVFLNHENIETIRAALSHMTAAQEAHMKNVPYTDGTPSREWEESPAGKAK